MNRAIFLDRDGVINVDKGYVHKIEDFEFTTGTIKALKYFQSLGYLLIIVTNQSGIGRGYYTKKDFYKLTSWMKNRLKADGIEIKEVYFCPHSPEENCKCRKPEPGMILKAAKDFDIDLKKSWMIGDKISDIKAAKRAGIENTIFIEEENKKRGEGGKVVRKEGKAKYIAKSLFDTISIIKE
nr:D-glycero-beta-D-manno-heptose 1,7-bisphosphate 7-phosphatase [Nitrosophilus kaiyonis]